MPVFVADPVQKHAKLTALQHALAPTHLDEQVSTDKLLDAISAVKANVQAQCDYLAPVPNQLAELSWFTQVSADELVRLDDIVQIVDMHSHIMMQRYVELGELYQQLQLDRTMLRRYKEIASELKEVSTDLRARFFELPHDAEIMRLMQQLSGSA